MKYFFHYADGIAGINIDDMGRLPSGRAWFHIKEPCAPEIGKRVASAYADDQVITQWVFDGHPSGEPLFVWTSTPRPSAEDERFMGREIDRLTGVKITPEPQASAADFERINRAALKRARKAMKRREGTVA
ncbi:hypothetical protein [Brevundimonas sp. Marseille-Q4549]